MKISIITIVKNGMPFVVETVFSVLSQDYKKIQYIVVDGLSTDGTTSFLLENKNSIASLVSEKDGGIADAFNKGLAQATGDYIMFLNADDRLYSVDSISSMVKAIEENGNPDFIYGDCDVLERYSDAHKYRASIDFTLDGIPKGKMPPHPSMLVHKSYFERYGKFDENFKIGMDFEWFIRGIRDSRIIHFPHVVTYVRDGGISTKNQTKVIAEILLALKKNNYFLSDMQYFGCWLYFMFRFISKIILTKLQIYKLLKKIFR